MDNIQKTTITLTLLHPEGEDLRNMSLAEIIEEADEGAYIGSRVVSDPVTVPPDQLKAELLAIGNDGEFFNGDED